MRDLVAPWFWKSVTLVLLVLVAWMSLLPGGEVPPPPFPYFDKVVHWGIYFLLAGWCLQIVKVGEIPTTLLLLFGYSTSIEFGQTFVPLRSADPLDLLANGVGMAAAYWIQFHRGHRSILEQRFRSRQKNAVPPFAKENKETLG